MESIKKYLLCDLGFDKVAYHTQFSLLYLKQWSPKWEEIVPSWVAQCNP